MTPQEKADTLVEQFGEKSPLVVKHVLGSFYNIFDDYIVDPSWYGGHKKMTKFWEEVDLIITEKI